MKAIHTIVAAVVLGAGVSVAQAGVTTLAEWDFQTSVPTTAGPHAAEGGVNGGSAIGFHTVSATVYSNPVGNGSTESFSSNNWSADDYYQFQTSTTGFNAITVQWDQTRSSTGPSDFTLQWSTDGSTFFDIMSYVVGTTGWSSGTNDPGSVHGPIALPAGADNQANIYIRMTADVAGASSGSNRIDNVIIASVPAPGALALLGLAGLVGGRRRRG